MSSDDAGLDMSTREVAGLIRSARNGDLSGEEIDNLWNRVPRQQKVQFLSFIFQERVIPHIEDIRQRAESEDSERLRDAYADLDPETKDEVLLETIGHIVRTLFELRERPREGMLNLKELIRDPGTMESLLLVFDDAEHIDPGYSADAKNFVSWYVTAAGVALAPELYDEATVREVYEAFDLELPDEDEL